MKLLTSLRQIPKKVALFAALSVMAIGIVIPTTAMAAAPQKCADKDVQCVIQFGDKLISDRQASLSKFSDDVNKELSAKHINADQAALLQTDITTNQNDLVTLKTKLDAETQASAARQDVLNIYVQLRIYAVVLPRDRRRLHLDIEITLHDKLKDAETALAARIAKAPSSEQAQLNTLFTDYKTQVDNAEAQIELAVAALPGLTVSNYNTNRSAYNDSLSAMSKAEEAAHDDLHSAAKDLHQIALILRSNKDTKATPTSSSGS